SQSSRTTCCSLNPAVAAAGAIRPNATPRQSQAMPRTGLYPLPRKRGREPLRGERDRVYRIGIDVGGTFTDLVAVDDLGKATLAKTPSTPEDPSVGVLDGLKLLAETLGRDRAALLSDTGRIVHGTTVATNALLERKGAR